jgi:hypothetical protein
VTQPGRHEKPLLVNKKTTAQMNLQKRLTIAVANKK